MTKSTLGTPSLIKHYLICPTCENNGKREVLGEVINNQFKIRRFHKSATIIEGPEFQVRCSECNDISFIRIQQ